MHRRPVESERKEEPTMDRDPSDRGEEGGTRDDPESPSQPDPQIEPSVGGPDDDGGPDGPGRMEPGKDYTPPPGGSSIPPDPE
jgi:hypothetical protein